jgi:CrcB protein
MLYVHVLISSKAIDGVSRLIFTIAIALSSLAFGLHIGKNIHPYIFPIKPPSRYTRTAVTVLSVCIYVLTIPLYVRLDPSFRAKATAALLFSFPGTLTRYVLSYLLNPRFKLFPTGTLTANSLGTALLATFHVLQATTAGSKPVPCGILQGLVDGFCGCLTTVSTFAVEVRELKGYRAWTYVILSCLIGQILCLVILGPSWWVANLNPIPVCHA